MTILFGTTPIIAQSGSGSGSSTGSTPGSTGSSYGTGSTRPSGGTSSSTTDDSRRRPSSSTSDQSSTSTTGTTDSSRTYGTGTSTSTTGTTGTDTAGGATTIAGRDSSGKLGWMDRRFVNKAADSGTTEINLAKLATERASNPEVKSFAQKLIDDHEKVSQELKSLASQKHVKLDEDDLGSDRAHKRLSKKSGTEFDQEFVEQMIDMHESDVKMFEKAASDAKDSELRAFASKHVDHLREHLRQAQSLRSTIMPTGRADTSTSTTDTTGTTGARSSTSTPTTDSTSGTSSRGDTSGTSGTTGAAGTTPGSSTTSGSGTGTDTTRRDRTP